ncbi:hypothetical protein AVEN_11913-1 [Araneus ventricosus]|uniref:Uncharacterized protein n=1 Tax=Araneus ventricosus TaxID=182803 RepID=A0A4Y2EW19_ARAVE|nr:hypothetical protein AVEN_11913-1 [Araneus ventricosus]
MKPTAPVMTRCGEKITKQDPDLKKACYDCEKPKVMLYRPENLCSDQIAKLQQSCSANLQACHGKSGSLKQVNANELVTTRQTCHKLAASNSLQTIEKQSTKTASDWNPQTTHFIARHLASALATQPAEV